MTDITPPSVLWAQNKTSVFLTFNVECKKPEIEIKPQKVHFKGLCEADKKLHEVDIELFAEIDPEKSKQRNKGRVIELVLAKAKSDGGFWSSLTADKKKKNWLKVDFNRWQDENDSEDEFDDMNDMFSSKMGGFDEEYEDANDAESSSSEEETTPKTE